MSSFMAGPFTATFNSLALGVVEDGFELEFFAGGEPIRGDNLGDMIQDVVQRGGDVFVNFTLLEWASALAALIFWPQGTTWGKVAATYTGSLATAAGAQALILSKVLTGSTPASLTASKAILAPGFPVRSLFASRLRRVPIRMQLLPYDATGVTFFALT